MLSEEWHIIGYLDKTLYYNDSILSNHQITFGTRKIEKGNRGGHKQILFNSFKNLFTR